MDYMSSRLHAHEPLCGCTGQVCAAVGHRDGSITVYDALDGSVLSEIAFDKDRSSKGHELEDRYDEV